MEPVQRVTTRFHEALQTWTEEGTHAAAESRAERGLNATNDAREMPSVYVPGMAGSSTDPPPPPAESGEASPARTRWRVTRPMLRAFGGTPGCDRCDDWSQPSTGLASHHGHTVQCRTRMHEAARSHPEHARRIDMAERRVDSAVVKRARETDVQPAPAVDGDVEMPPAGDDPPPKTLRLGKLVMDPNVDPPTG